MIQKHDKTFPVCWVNNLFSPQDADITESTAGQSIADWLDRHGGMERLNTRPVVCVYRGRELMRSEYATTRIEDAVCFVTLPQGGGDSGGGSNPVAMVAMLAVAVLAPMVAPAIASGIGFAGSAVAAGAIQAGIMLAGGLVINAMMPLPGPPESTRQAISQSQTSPTYALQAQGNVARMGAPVPVQYGAMRIYPDFASQPYTQFSNNEQMLHMRLMLGEGEHEISDIRFDDTQAESFTEVKTHVNTQYRPVIADEVINVTEAGGQSMNEPGERGPFVINPLGTIISNAEVDIVFPAGLIGVNSSTGQEFAESVRLSIYTQRYDEETGLWEAEKKKVDDTVTRQTRTPQRITYTLHIGWQSHGRYRVSRIVRHTAAGDSYHTRDMQIAGIKGFLHDTERNGGRTTLEIRARATDRLNNQVASKVNCLCVRKIPVWDGTKWTEPVATANPAWVFADAVRGYYGKTGTDVEQPYFDDSALDLDELKSLADLYDARGDTFHGRFDTESNLWEVLTKIAQAGRAMPVRHGNKIRMVRDQYQSVPVAMFSGANCRNLSLDYALYNGRTADAVRVLFRDRDTDYKQQSVVCSPPGSASLNVRDVHLFGITDRKQAIREGAYLVATNYYRRQFVSWETGMEGYIPAYGDTVLLNHPLLSEAMHSGTIVACEDAVLTLDQDVSIHDDELWYIAFRSRNGEPSVPLRVGPGERDNTLHLLETLPDDVELVTDPNGPPTQFMLGIWQKWQRKVKVNALEPLNDHTVRISGVVEDDRVHKADIDLVPQSTYRTSIHTKTEITEVVAHITRVDDKTVRIRMSWEPQLYIRSYTLRVRYGELEQYTDLASVTDPLLDMTVPPAMMEFEILADQYGYRSSKKRILIDATRPKKIVNPEKSVWDTPPDPEDINNPDKAD